MAKNKLIAPELANKENGVESTIKKKRTILSQSEVPSVPLTQAMRIISAIADNYAKTPTKPLRVAEAMDMTISSGGFRNLCGAAIAYGLTDGGYNAELISITALGKRIIAPQEEGDDIKAIKEACLTPRIIKDFLQKYNNNKLPAERIVYNVLEEMGVPTDKLKRTWEVILENSIHIGFIREIKGNKYVDIDLNSIDNPSNREIEEDKEIDVEKETEYPIKDDTQDNNHSIHTTVLAQSTIQDNNRVFITHGKNKDIVSQLKEILAFGKFHPVVSVETESVSKPVPDKVLDEMRSCYAAIIHVNAELQLMDAEGNQHVMLNPNVLIEIGAAMALFSRRFILLVERGVSLPSNLQGLYEVRYEGNKLDYDATMKLLKAFNEFKS